MLLEQANVEMTASLTYLSISYWFDDRGMSGFSDHFRKASDEEKGHSMEFLDYVTKRGGKARVLKVEETTTTFDDPLKAMEFYLDKERAVADSINSKYARAMELKDWPTVSFLQPFVAYQVEEEDEADNLMQEMYRLSSKRDLSQLMDDIVTRRATKPEK